MKLLLDEMISPSVAWEMRKLGCDVEAIKRDRPELTGRADEDLLSLMAVERRAIVTNDVADFQLLHDRWLSSGREHFGLVFTFDASLPRSNAAIPEWVRALPELLASNPRDDALRNRVLHLL